MLAILRQNPGDDRAVPSSREDALAGGALPDFETLLRLYHKRVFSLIYRLIGNPDEVADLTQETFVRAFRAYPRFRGSPTAVYPWLCRIAVNGCKNRFREIGRREKYEWRSLDDPVESGDDRLTLEMGDATGDPLRAVEQHELEGKIQEAIQALPPEYRTVLVLRDMQGLSYQEIADAAELSLEVVKVRLFRARGVLRRRLAPYLAA